ncbi:MAG: peptide deformylase [Pseudomonadota bacterium]
MALREIKIFPDPALRKTAEPVTAFDEALRNLVNDMIETMVAHSGVGLAAPQVGVSQRVIIIDAGPEDGDEDDEGEDRRRMLILVNPEIAEEEGELTWNEGCLSFPGIYEDINRASRVVVNACDIDGVNIMVEGEGLLAVALQHEIDHLDGALIFDYMSYIRKKLVKRELKKKVEQMKKETEDSSQGLV